MSQDKFEIKITNEINGKDVNLEDLSLEASKSLVVILDSMTKIAESENINKDLRIKVKKGSASVEIQGHPKSIESISRNFTKVTKNQSTDYIYVENLRNIQKVIQQNGLGYSATIWIDGKGKDVLPLFRNSKTFSKKRRSSKDGEDHFHIEFFNGRLIEVGGKKPNIHIEQAGQKYTIQCNESQAILVNDYLYKDLKVSAWVKVRPDDKLTYIFCDHYTIDNEYLDIKKAILDNMSMSGTEPLKHIHKKLHDYISLQNFDGALKFINIFNNDIVDKGRLRSLLVIMKSFKTDQKFKNILEQIVEKLEKKTGNKII